MNEAWKKMRKIAKLPKSLKMNRNKFTHTVKQIIGNWIETQDRRSKNK